MKKSRLLPLALCFLSLFLILGVQGYAQNCTAFAGPGNVPLETGVGASLNGFLPFGGSVPTLYGPAAWNYQVYNATTQTYAPGFSVDPNSAAIIAQINHGDKIGGKPAPLHPDFGPAGGMPYTVVDSSSQPAINLYGLKAGPDSPESAASQSDAVVEPAPLTAPIEGQQADCLSYPANGEGEGYYFGDTHMLIVDRNQCFLYETYLTSRCDGVISAGGQAIWDLEYGEVRPYGWTSTDAAGLPVWPGLVKFDEACSTYVNDVDDVNNDGNCAVVNPAGVQHAFRMTVNRTKGDGNGGYFVFPAGHGASGGYNYKYLNVMGMRMILNPTTDISSFSPINQTLLTAMMQYGLILADNGSDMFVTGTTDSRWNTDDLGNWHGGGPIDCGNAEHAVGTPCYITSADFEVVQMSNEDVNQTDLASGDWTAAQSVSYLDANSAPYTVWDVENGVTAAGDPGYPDVPTAIGTVVAGGLGPEGTGITAGSGGKYPSDGDTGTSGPAPTINAFGAYYDRGGFGPQLCGSQVNPGTPVYFVSNISAGPIAGYQYVDNAGPFRTNGLGSGYVRATITNTQTFTLYAMNSAGLNISAGCTIYTANAMLPTPVLAPATGTYNTIISVTISDPGYPGATIFYTTDETEPAEVGGVPQGTTQIYTGAITITGTTPDPNTYLPGEQINAIAVDLTGTISTPSGVGSAVYIVNSQAPAPTFAPASGSYELGQVITISEDPSFEPIDINQDGDTPFIYYTTDGTTPGGDWYGDTTGTSIACAVGVNGGPCTYTLTGGATVLNAVATAVGYSTSTVANANYNVSVTFTLAATPAMVTINPGGNASALSISVSSVNGYVGTVNLSCSGLPPGDLCSFSPSAVAVAVGVPGVSALTVSSGGNSSNHSFPLLPGGATLAVALCCFGLRKRRNLQLIVLLGASVIGLSLFTGCGTPGSLPNTVTVTVTGTDSSDAPTASTSFTLTQMQSL